MLHTCMHSEAACVSTLSTVKTSRRSSPLAPVCPTPGAQNLPYTVGEQHARRGSALWMAPAPRTLHDLALAQVEGPEADAREREQQEGEQASEQTSGCSYK